MRGLVRQLLLGGIAGKALGAGREVVAAWCFGTGLVANSFRMAQAAFILPLQIFVSDLTTGVFTPLYARWRHERPEDALRLFVALHGCLLFLAAIVAIGIFTFAHAYIALLAPGFSNDERLLTVRFVQLLALALPPYVVSTIYCAVELVHGHGRITSVRASFQSIGLLVGTAAAWFLSMPWLIAAGFVCAHFVVASWGFRHCRSLGIRFSVAHADWRLMPVVLKPVWNVFRVSMWIPVGLQLSQIVERRIASSIHPGAVAGLDYARFVTETLLVLMAMPLGMAGQASMPTMKDDDFRSKTARSLRTLALVGIPLSVLLSVSARPIVDLLFHRGAFDANSSEVTASIMSGQAAGLAFLLIGYTGQKFLNARAKNGAVLRSVVAGTVVSILSNLLLARWLGPAVLGVSAALTALAVCLVVVCSLQQVTAVIFELRWWWTAAVLHLTGVVMARYLWIVPWPLELAAGLSYWLTFTLTFPANRHLLLDTFAALKRGR